MYQPYQSTWNNPYLTANSVNLPYQAQPYQQPVNGIVKVNGAQSAMQYQLPPNSTSPALFDASGTCFYVVSTDGTGTKSIECFDFTPHVEKQPQQIDTTQYVTRAEFDALLEKVSQMIGADNGTNAAVQDASAAE